MTKAAQQCAVVPRARSALEGIVRNAFRTNRRMSDRSDERRSGTLLQLSQCHDSPFCNSFLCRPVCKRLPSNPQNLAPNIILSIRPYSIEAAVKGRMSEMKPR
jgi:hypothetical protein